MLTVENATWVWVRITGDGLTQETAWMPDLPLNEDGLPTMEFLHEGTLVEDALETARPAIFVAHANIGVSADDAKELTRLGKVVPDAAVPERDWIAVRMVREVIRGEPGQLEGRADSLFSEANLPGIGNATADRKRSIVAVLEQTGPRGLSVRKRLEIAERLGIADVDPPRRERPE